MTLMDAALLSQAVAFLALAALVFTLNWQMKSLVSQLARLRLVGGGHDADPSV